MRITLASTLHTDISAQLSRALELPLIEAKPFTSPTTGLPSDDLTMLALVKAIQRQMEGIDDNSGFVLTNCPQNVIQAQSLDMALARIGQPLSSALLMESTKKPQNRENRALIRYYRTQNKLILLDEAESIDELCNRIQRIYEKRRSSAAPANTDLAQDTTR